VAPGLSHRALAIGVPVFYCSAKTAIAHVAPVLRTRAAEAARVPLNAVAFIVSYGSLIDTAVFDVNGSLFDTAVIMVSGSLLLLDVVMMSG
jgi:hypothetical protein